MRELLVEPECTLRHPVAVEKLIDHVGRESFELGLRARVVVAHTLGHELVQLLIGRVSGLSPDQI